MGVYLWQYTFIHHVRRFYRCFCALEDAGKAPNFPPYGSRYQYGVVLSSSVFGVCELVEGALRDDSGYER